MSPQSISTTPPKSVVEEPKPQGVLPVEPEVRPTVIMSELDSYIYERMKGQPKTLEEVEHRVEVGDEPEGKHRLMLPAFFEKLSFDHTKGNGKYVFRWIFKDKRSVDKALNVTGWTLVNRTYFPEAPKYLFTANGGVEVGDAILAFMLTKKALAIRMRPSELSRERISSQMTPMEVEENEGGVKSQYVLMSGNPHDPKVYKPTLSKEGEGGIEATSEEPATSKDF